jgi:hypothetical protein
MPRPQCPGCRAPLSVLSIVSAATPYHLKCGTCKLALRVRGGIEPIALVVACGVGIVIGVRTVWNGIVAEAPLAIGLLVGWELVAIVSILTFGKLERRD